MRCAKCDAALRRIVIDDVEVDRCDGCGGIWFDSGELRRILSKKRVDELRSEARARREREEDDARRGHCPRCGGAGLLVQVATWEADIHIDTCAVCGGQWLDAGELEILRGEAGLLGGVLDRIRRLVS